MGLLGSTSLLFFICVTPMVALSLTFSRQLLHSFTFQVTLFALNPQTHAHAVFFSLIKTSFIVTLFLLQVFRSAANLLELTNYSITFYIYCLFSREFRATFAGLISGVRGGGGPFTGESPHGTKPSHQPTPTPSLPKKALLNSGGGGSTPLLLLKHQTITLGPNGTVGSVVAMNGDKSSSSGGGYRI
jgi:hypothetical protein